MTGNEAVINIFFYYQPVALILSATYREKKNRRDDPWKTLLQSYNPLTSFLPVLSSCLCVLSYTADSSLPKREAKKHVSFTGYASYWCFCSCSGISVISLSLPQSTICDLRTAACFLWSRQSFIRKFNSRWGQISNRIQEDWKTVSIGKFAQTSFPVLISLLYCINVLTGGNWEKVPNWHLFLLLPYRNSLLIYL